MAGYTLSALEADIRSYTEVDSTVFSGATLGRFIENAEYRINLDIWVFFIAGILAVIIALLTVSYQSIKAAIANPSDSLRYE